MGGVQELMDSATEERFHDKYIVDVSTGCWLWCGRVGQNGYAEFNLGGGKKLAHRVFYEHAIGRVPEGLELDHLCRVRHCVNPHHLEPVTHAENVRRGLKGILATACKYGHAHTEENIRLSRGRRVCRACEARRQREYKVRKVAA